VAYCDLQGLNRNKFKNKFKKVVRMGLKVEGYGYDLSSDG